MLRTELRYPFPAYYTAGSRVNALLSRESSSARRALGQDPLQGPAVHVEPARRLRDVAIAHFIDALDVFPAHAVRRHRVLRRLGFFRAGRQQCSDDVIGIGGLGEIID